MTTTALEMHRGSRQFRRPGPRPTRACLRASDVRRKKVTIGKNGLIADVIAGTRSRLSCRRFPNVDLPGSAECFSRPFARSSREATWVGAVAAQQAWPLAIAFQASSAFQDASGSDKACRKRCPYVDSGNNRDATVRGGSARRPARSGFAVKGVSALPFPKSI